MMAEARRENTMVNRAMILGAIATAFAATFTLAPAKADDAMTKSLGGDLSLSDFGSFFVGGKIATTQYPDAVPKGLLAPGDISTGQMYVQFLVPREVTGPALVLVHGFNHTGATFETTPDGREGWATYFVRKGHPVYTVDMPGRGRSGFDPSKINEAKAKNDTRAMPSLPLYGLQGAWINFRFGKQYPVPYPNMQFPLEALEQYARQLVPSAESTFGEDTAVQYAALIADLGMLLEKIGPAVILAHSQGGGIALSVAQAKPGLTAAFVSVEGDCNVISKDPALFARIPFLSVFGDNTVGAPGFNGDKRRDSCIDAVKALTQQGAQAKFQLLAEVGMPGHSHMMMMDKGNLEIADFIENWLREPPTTSRYKSLKSGVN
jgi:pimeloyl-ACP methyl ester carboxylesterase